MDKRFSRTASVRTALAVLLSGVTTMAGGQSWDIDYDKLLDLNETHSRIALTDEISEQDITINETLFPVLHTLSVKSPDLYGLHGSAEMFLQDGNLNEDVYKYLAPQRETAAGRTMQVQAKAIYSGRFTGGNVDLWLGATWQDQEQHPLIANPRTEESLGYNVGIDFNLEGFNLAGSYFEGELMDFQRFNPQQARSGYDCYLAACLGDERQGYIVRGGYRFGATQLAVSYGESSLFTHSLGRINENSELWTIGIHHEVNNWFKLTAEISDYDNTSSDAENSRQFSVGGYIRW